MKPNERTSDVAEENEGKPQENERQQRDQLRRQILEEARSKQLEKKIKKKARRKVRNKKLPVAGTSYDQSSARSSLLDTSSNNGCCREQTSSSLQNDGSMVSSKIFDHRKPLDLDAGIFTYMDVKKSESSASDLPYLHEETAHGGLFHCLLKPHFPKHLPLNACSMQLQKCQIQIILSQYYTGADTSNEDLKPCDEIAPYCRLMPQNLQHHRLQLIVRKLLGEAKFNALMKKCYYQEMFASLPLCPVMMEISGLIVAAQKSDAVKEFSATTSSRLQMLKFERECKASDAEINVALHKSITADRQSETDWVEMPQVMQLENLECPPSSKTQMVPSCKSLKNSLANVDEIQGCPLAKVDVAVYQCSNDDCQIETSWAKMPQCLQCQNQNDGRLTATVKAELVPCYYSLDNSEFANAAEVSHNVEGCSVAKVDVAVSQCSVDGCQSETSSVDIPQQMQCANGESPSTSKPLLVPSSNSFDNTEMINVDKVSHSVEGYSLVDVPVNKSFTDGRQSETSWMEVLQHMHCENDNKEQLVPPFENSEFASVDVDVYQCSTDDCQPETSWGQIPQPVQCDNDESLPDAKAQIVLSCSGSENSELANVDVAVYKCCTNDNQSETSWEHKFQHMQCKTDKSSPAAKVQMVPSCNSFQNSELTNVGEVSHNLEIPSLTAADSELQKDAHSLTSEKECVHGEDSLNERNVTSELYCPVEEEFVPDNWDDDLLSGEDVGESTSICVTADVSMSMSASNTDVYQPDTSWFREYQPRQCENDESLSNTKAHIVLFCSSSEKSGVAKVDDVSHNVESQSLASVDEALYKCSTNDNQDQSESSWEHKLQQNYESCPPAKVQMRPSCNSLENSELTNFVEVSYNLESQSLTAADSESHKDARSLNCKRECVHGEDSINEKIVTSDLCHPIEEFVPDNWDDDLLSDEDVSESTSICVTADASVPMSNTDDYQTETSCVPGTLQCENDESSPTTKAQIVLSCNISENSEVAKVDDVSHNVERQSLANVDNTSHNVESQPLANVDYVSHNLKSQSLANIDVAVYKCSTNDSQSKTSWEEQHMQCENYKSSPAAKVQMVPSCTSLELTNIGEIQQNVEGYSLANADIAVYQCTIDDCQSETWMEVLQCENDVGSPVTKPQLLPSCNNLENLESTDANEVSHDVEGDSLANVDVAVYKCTTDNCQSETSWVKVPQHVQCNSGANHPTTKAQLMSSCNSFDSSKLVNLGEVSHIAESQPFTAAGTNVDSESQKHTHNLTSGKECVHYEDFLKERNVSSQLWCPIRQEFVPDNWDDELLSDEDVSESTSICVTDDVSMSKPAYDRTLFAGAKSNNTEKLCKQLLDVEISEQNIGCCQEVVTNGTGGCDNKSNQSTNSVPDVRGIDLVKSWEGRDEVKLSDMTVPLHPNTAVMNMQQQEANCQHKDSGLNKPDLKWLHITDGLVVGSEKKVGAGKVWSKHNGNVWQTRVVSNQSRLRRLQSADQFRHAEAEMNNSGGKAGLIQVVSNQNQPQRLQIAERNDESHEKVSMSCVGNQTQTQRLQTAEQLTQTVEERNKSNVVSNQNQPKRLQTVEMNKSSEKVLLPPVISNENQPQILQIEEQLTCREEERNTNNCKVWPTQVVSNQSPLQRLQTAELLTHTQPERNKRNGKLWLSRVVCNQKQPWRLQTELLKHQLNGETEKELRNETSFRNKSFGSFQNSPVKNVTEDGIMLKAPELTVSNSLFESSNNFIPVNLVNLKEAKVTDEYKDELGYSTDIVENNLQSKSFPNLSAVVNSSRDCSFHNMENACELDNNVHRNRESAPDGFSKVGTAETRVSQVLNDFKRQQKTEIPLEINNNIYRKWELVPDSVSKVGASEISGNHVLIDFRHQQNAEIPPEFNNNVYKKQNFIPGAVLNVGTAETSVNHFKLQQQTEIPLEFNNSVYRNRELIPDSILKVATAETSVNCVLSGLKHQQKTEFPPVFLTPGNSANAEMYSDRQIFMSGRLPVEESTVPTNLNINSSPGICTTVPPTELHPSPVHIASDHFGHLPTQSDLNKLVAATLQKQQERLYLLLCDLQAKVLALARILKTNTTKSPLAGRSDIDSFKNTGSLPADKELSLEQIEAIIDRFVPVLNKHIMSVPEHASAKSIPQNKHTQNSQSTFSLQRDKKEKQSDQRELSDAELDNILKRLHMLGINDLMTHHTREQSTALSVVHQSCQDRSLESDGCFRNPPAHSRLPKCPPATCGQKPTLRKTKKKIQTPLFQNKKTNKTVSSCKVEADHILQYPEIHSRISPEVTQGLQELRGQWMTKQLESENLTVTPAKTESFVTLSSSCKSTEEDKTNIPEHDKSKTLYKFFRGRMVKVPGSEPINKEKEILPGFTAVGFPAEVGQSLPTFKEPSKSFSLSGSAPSVPRNDSVVQTKELSHFNYRFPSLSQRPVYTVSKTLPKKSMESYTKVNW